MHKPHKEHAASTPNLKEDPKGSAQNKGRSHKTEPDTVKKLQRSKSSPNIYKSLRTSINGREGFRDTISIPGTGAHRVGFKNQLEFYDENDIDLWSLFKFVIQLMLHTSPLRMTQEGDIPRFTGTTPSYDPRHVASLQLRIPNFSYFQFAHFVLWASLPILYPLVALCIPMKESPHGSVSRHVAFSLGSMLFFGVILSFYTVLWLESYFGVTMKGRYFTAVVAGLLAPVFHITMSFASGGVLRFGPNLCAVFVVIVAGVGAYITLPKDQGSGVKGRLAIALSVLISIIFSIYLIAMLETANDRGQKVAYFLIIILPVIFTRLTTDIQEALPNTSLEFSIVSQGFLTYVFSFCTYDLLVHFSKQVNFWKLYLVLTVVDMTCVFGVGPIWSLWSKAGYLRTSKYMQTIFGWAQNPIKPRPIIVKYYTRLTACVAFAIILSALRASGNKNAITSSSEKVIDSRKLREVWACLMIDALLSTGWIIFIYRVMKIRCSKEAFNGVVIQFSKNFCYLQTSAALAGLTLFLINSEQEHGL